MRLGMLYTLTNHEDITHYKDVLIEICKNMKDVTLVVFGYKQEEDADKVMDDLDFEYVKPVSMIHYFKQLKALNIDVLFIPLIRNVYNSTSENYNKYLECAIFHIPVIAPNIYPYNITINHNINGYLYDDSIDLLSTIDKLRRDDASLKKAGNIAYIMARRDYNLSEENIKTLIEFYT